MKYGIKHLLAVVALCCVGLAGYRLGRGHGYQDGHADEAASHAQTKADLDELLGNVDYLRQSWRPGDVDDAVRRIRERRNKR